MYFPLYSVMLLTSITLVLADPLFLWHSFLHALKVRPLRIHVNFRTLTTYTPHPPKRPKLSTTPSTISSTESTRVTTISTLSTAPQQSPTDAEYYDDIFRQPTSETPRENQAPFFRNDYTYVPSTDTFYKFHKVKSDWSNALSTCITEGAELAVPKTEGEATVLRDQFSSSADNIWLAVHDKFAEGLFFTHDGSPLSSIYSNWSPGEPNDVADKDGEDCVSMNKAGFYNDIVCEKKINFVCSTGNKNFTQNIACQTYDKSYIKEGRDRCYKLHTRARTWHDAFKTCRDEQAYLTVINSDAEADILVEKFASAPNVSGNFERRYLLVDFSDLHVHGVYRTQSGGKPLEESGYIEWGAGQPDNYLGNEHCGSIFRDGKLNDISCNIKCMFICEKDIKVQPKAVVQTTQATQATGADLNIRSELIWSR